MTSDVEPFTKVLDAGARRLARRRTDMNLDMRLLLTASARMDTRRRAKFGRGELARDLALESRNTLSKAIRRGIEWELYEPGSTSTLIVLSASVFANDTGTTWAAQRRRDAK